MDLNQSRLAIRHSPFASVGPAPVAGVDPTYEETEGDVSGKPTLAIVGGTGALGSGLAGRWAAAGYEVIIGSRSVDKAEAAARALEPVARGARPRAASNAEASRAGDIVILAVPWTSHPAILDEIAPCIAGKMVVDTTVPLVPPKVARVQLPAGDARPPSRRSGGSAMPLAWSRRFTMWPPPSCRPTRRSIAMCWCSGTQRRTVPSS